MKPLRIFLKPANPAIWWTIFILWALTVIALSSLTGSEVARVLPNTYWHKFCHLLAFGSGAFILALCFRLSSKWRWLRVSLTAIIVISIYGATDEWHQLYTPGRGGGSVWDWLTDTIGAALGVCLLLYVKHRFEKRTGKSCCASRGN